MRREREGTYHAYRLGTPDFYQPQRIPRTRRDRVQRALHNDRSFLPTIQRSRNGVPIISGRYIPALSELKRIKEVKIRRIRDMVRKGTYDTIERQIETARKIADTFLAEKGLNN